jgi:hypothetical protein
LLFHYRFHVMGTACPECEDSYDACTSLRVFTLS